MKAAKTYGYPYGFRAAGLNPIMSIDIFVSYEMIAFRIPQERLLRVIVKFGLGLSCERWRVLFHHVIRLGSTP